MIRCLYLMISICLTLCALLCSSSKSVVNKYHVKVLKVPLIKFIPLKFTFHHYLVIREDQTSNINPTIIMDFVPVYRSFDFNGLKSSLLLLGALDQPGKVRIKYINKSHISQEFNKTIDSILSNWDDSINIYNHNCQHFSRFASIFFLLSGQN